MVEKIVAETLSEKVYQNIKAQITSNKLLPGQQLIIDQLAEQFGISPTPVREALANLSAEGLVERFANKTPRVAPISEKAVQRSYELRLLLEPYLVGVAIENLPHRPNLVDQLISVRKKALQIQAKATALKDLTPDEYEKHQSVGLVLQDVLLAALDDDFLSRLCSSLADYSVRIRLFAEASDKRHAIEMVHTINDEHLVILDALLAGDKNRAQRATKEHLSNAAERTLQATKGKGETAL